MDSRDPGFGWYVAVTCGLPAAALAALMLWRPAWYAWWAGGELAAIAALSGAWKLAGRRRAVRLPGREREGGGGPYPRDAAGLDRDDAA